MQIANDLDRFMQRIDSIDIASLPIRHISMPGFLEAFKDPECISTILYPNEVEPYPNESHCDENFRYVYDRGLNPPSVRKGVKPTPVKYGMESDFKVPTKQRYRNRKTPK